MWYGKSMSRQRKKKATLKDERFVVLDFETTGLEPLMGDEICEYALVEIVAGETRRRFSELVNPGRSIPPEAIAVHGITNEMTSGKRSFDEALADLLAFIDDATLVMHNAGFDMGFLQVRLAVLGKPPLRNLTVDTLELSRRVRSNPASGHRLVDIVRDYGIEESRFHRALGDAEMTARVFLKLAEELETTEGEVTLERLGARPCLGVPATPETLAIAGELRRAIAENRRVEIVYDSRGSGRTRRQVDPETLAAFHMVGYCHLREARLQFRLDRIREIRMLPVASGSHANVKLDSNHKKDPPGDRRLQGTEPPAC